MFNKHHFNEKEVGITSVGERGQVVIPAEIREKLKLEKGEKLVVFSRSNRFIMMFRANEMNSWLKKIQDKIQGDL